MKFFFEFIPLLAFFIALIKYDLYVATIVLMVALPIQITLIWLYFKKIEKMHWITLMAVLLFGSATVFFKNPLIIKWKPTIVNWIFALIFLISQWVSNKPFIQHMLGKQIQLPKEVWLRLNLSWVFFFVALGVANLYFAYQFDTLTWAKFKVFGTLGLTLVFVVGQGVYMSRFMNNHSPD